MRFIETEYYGVIQKENQMKMLSMGKALINPEMIGSFQEYFHPNYDTNELDGYWKIGLKNNVVFIVSEDDGLRIINEVKE